MDQVVEEVENVKKEFEETYKQTQQHIKSIHEYGKSRLISEEKSSLSRLNGVAQDGMNFLQSLQFKYKYFCMSDNMIRCIKDEDDKVLMEDAHIRQR
ncbi:hypothetical protein K7X08_010755 [Anisodus acutangulus]|uniref:Uncharacterized protein n=1 Tax=Anisodus acutangulus TaxID=402998 RepID=A0A9Q1M1G6_9SOLA|nr:hypothetical protein K7X08_010755 [Anisodus acutangulus]